MASVPGGQGRSGSSGLSLLLPWPTPAVTNPCDRKKCEWLCLLSPSGPVCTCPNGKRLDNGTCVAVPSPTPPPDGRLGPPCPVPCPGPPPAAPEFPPPWLCLWSSPQPLGREPVTCSASTAAAASSTPGGSPSAAASPATRGTSASWTSAGSTAKMGAPARPPPRVRPPLSQRDCSQPLGPSPQTHCRLRQIPSPALPSPLPPARLLPQPRVPPPAVCLPPRASQPCSSAVGPGSSVGRSPTHTSSPQACPRAAAPRASRAPGAPSRCVRATVPTTAPARSTRATSPSADAYLASWVTAANTVS